MTDTQKVHVTFTVELTDTQWAYQAKKKGNAEMQVVVPRSTIENIDAGNLFQAILATALNDWDNYIAEEGDAENEF